MADVVVPEGWELEQPTEAPVAPEGWELEAPGGNQPASDPLVAAAPAPVEDPLAAGEPDFTPVLRPEDQAVADAREQFDADRAKVKLAFSNLVTSSPLPEAAEVRVIAQSLGVDDETVRDNLKAWRATAQAADFNETRWMVDNPGLARLMLRHPKAAPLVVEAHQELSIITKGLRVANEMGFGKALAADPTLLYDQAKDNVEAIDTLIKTGRWEDPAFKRWARIRAEWDKANVAKTVQALDDEEAKAARGNPLAVAGIRYREARDQAKRAKLGWAIMRAEMAGEDTATLETELRSVPTLPRSLEEGSLMRVVSDAASGIGSSVDALSGALERGSMGAVAAGAVATAVTKNPAVGARAMALGGRLGLSYGAAEATMVAETGDTFLELRDTKDDFGRPLERDVVISAAIVAGALKTGVEMAEFELQLKTLGPLKAALTGDMAALKVALGRDAGLRAWVKRVAPKLMPGFKAAAGESVEEGVQTATEQATKAGAITLSQGRLSAAPVFDKDEIINAMGQALPAGFAMAMPGPVAALTVEAVASSREQRAAQSLPAVMQLAEQPAVQAAPEAFAELVKQATSEGGAPLEAVYVDPQAVLRYYQEKSGATADEAAAELDKLLGPDGSQKVAEAAVAGHRVEVPMEAVLKSWGASEVGKAVLPSTATTADGLTQGQRSPEALAAREEEAKRIAAEQLAEMAKEQALDARVKEFEDQATAARAPEAGQKRAREEARAAAATLKHFMRTQARDFGQAVEELFPETPVAVARGDQQASTSERVAQGPALPADLVAFEAALSDAERQQLLYVDVAQHGETELGGTGLNTRRAWDATKRTPGTQVGVITVPDFKAINDFKKGGHDVSNRLLRLLGKAAGQATTGMAARSGPDILVEVRGQADLSSIVAKVQAAAPKGVQVLGFLGKDTVAAFAAADAGTATRRALPEGNINRVLPRGQTAFERDTLTDDAFPSEPAGRAVPQELGRQPAPAGEAFVREALLDRQMPGVRSRLGFLAAPKKRFSLSIDLRGLKAINTLFANDKEKGDRVLALFAQAAMAVGGAKLFFAHMSGDEFAAKADNQAELEAFRDALADQLSHVGVPATIDGKQHFLRPQFREGIAEGAYGKADQELNRKKADEPGGKSDLADPIAAAVADLRAAGVLHEGAPGGEGGVRGAVHAAGVAQGEGVAREGPADDRGAGSPRGGGEDAGGVTRLEQDGDQGSAPKGYANIPEARRLHETIRVFLNPTADASTLVHETAHAFLEHLGDLAQRPDAPERTKATYQQALKGLGVEKRAEMKRAHHEKFARGFEAWLFEGKAPKPELASAFQRFKLWLTDIYRTIRGIPGAELNDDLRGAFEALLATEDELEAFRRRQGPAAEKQGATAEEKQAAREAEREAMGEAGRRAELLALKDRLRVTEAWWKAGLEKLRAQFSEEYERLPARRAQRLIAGEEGGDPIVMDRTLVEAVIGKARVPGMKLAADGVRPSQVAEVTGFPSATVMLAELAGLKPKDRWVAEQAKATMEAQHPSVLEERTELKRLVADGLASYAAKRVGEEIKATPEEKATLKRAAELMASGYLVGNIHPSRALAAERTAARLKAEAAAKGEWEKAGEAGRRELLNIYLFKALSEAQREVERLEDLAEGLQKRSAQERLGKAQPVYRDAVNYLLGLFGLAEVDETLSAAVVQRAVDQMNGDAVLIGDPAWLDVLADAPEGDVRKLTMEQARHLDTALRNLREAARKRSLVLKDEQLADIEQAEEEVLKEWAEHLPEQPAPVSAHARTRTEKVKARVNAMDGFLLNPIDMFRELVGDNQNSTTWKVFVNPLRRGLHLEADLLKRAVEPISKAFEALPKDVKKSAGDLVDFRKLFPQHPEAFLPRFRYELWMLALNAGNESNLAVLTEGRKISEAQVRAALNLLTKEEINFINTIHEQVESLREPAFDLEQRETGVRPEPVEGRPMTLTNGTLRGGYFPLRAEQDAGRVGAVQAGAEALASLFDPTFTRPTTTHGHLKSRTGATYVVSLDPDGLRKHMHKVVHDIAFREAVKSVGRMLMRDKVQAELKKRLGTEKAKEPLIWLKDIGGAHGLESNGFAELLRWLKKNMGTSMLSGLSTAVGNFANLPAAVAGTKLQSKHLAAALAQFGAAPRATYRAVMEQSGQFRAMENNLVAGLEKEFVSFRAGAVKRRLAWVAEAGLAAMRAVDMVVSTSVWVGAHRQALAEGKDAKEAVRWADDILTQVQPQASPVEKARILRDRGVIGALTMFYGYLSVAYRTQHRLAAPLRSQAFRQATPGRRAIMAGRVAGGLLGFWLAYQVLGELLMGRGPEAGDEDDDDPDNQLLKWRNWFVRKMLVAPFAPLPFGVGQAIEATVLGKRPMSRTDPVGNMVGELFAAGRQGWGTFVEGEDDLERTVSRGLRVFGLMTGAPTRFLETTGKYVAWQAPFGESEVTPMRAVSGGVYGERENQPDNIFTVIEALLMSDE